MKQRKIKSLLALLLSSTMVLSLAACGADNKDASDASQSEKQSEEKTDVSTESKESEETADEEEVLDPITLTLGVRFCDYGNGVHTDKNVVLQTIKDKFNVEFDFVVYDQESVGLMAAGGDFPDIFMTYEFTPGLCVELIKSGHFLALDDLLSEHGENILANMPEALENMRNYADDGKIYALPSGVIRENKVPSYAIDYGMQFRYDIYKEIGSPEMNDWDEFLDVLKQMQDYERERTGADDIYAISAWTDWGTWFYVVGYPFSAGYSNFNGDCSYNRVDGVLETNYIDENSMFWDMIKLYNEAWNMGIFDPDSFTQKADQYYDKVSNGKVLVSINNAAPSTDVCGENACMVQAPVKGRTIRWIFDSDVLIGNAYTDARTISKNCEYPERAMQVLNYLETQEGVRLLMDGPQGVTWDYVDGRPQFIGELKAAYEAGEGASEIRKPLTGDAFGGNLLNCGYVADGDGYPNRLTATEDFYAIGTSPAFRAFAADYGCSYPGQVYAKWIEEGLLYTDMPHPSHAVTAVYPMNSDETNQIVAESDNYFMANVASVIMAETDDDFEKAKKVMIDKFVELGGEAVWEEMQQLWKETEEKLAAEN